MAADDVGEDLWKARGVFEVFFRVVPVDGALRVAIPVFLSLGQVVIARLHGCQQAPLFKKTGASHTHTKRTTRVTSVVRLPVCVYLIDEGDENHCLPFLLLAI